MRHRFGAAQTNLAETVPAVARFALECIGNSDALYHNVEHTLLVTLVGHDILRGRSLHDPMTADDYAQILSTNPFASSTTACAPALRSFDIS